MSVWRNNGTSCRECFHLLFIIMRSIWLLAFPSADVQVKGAAYNEFIFLHIAQANEPFDVADCVLTHHSSSAELLH